MAKFGIAAVPTSYSIELGFARIVFLVTQIKPDDQWPALERLAALIRKFA